MYKFQPIAPNTLLTTVKGYDPITSVVTPGQVQVATKGYIVTAFEGVLPLGIVFQTEECGKQWVAIDRLGHFWPSFGNTRQHAADWLLKRARA